MYSNEDNRIKLLKKTVRLDLMRCVTAEREEIDHKDFLKQTDIL